MLNVFNRNMIRKERLGQLFVCRRKSKANASSGFQEGPNAFYVIANALGVLRRSRYHIWPECIADLHHTARMLVGRESHFAHALLF